MEVTYEKINNIPLKSVVTFREYSLDRNEKRILHNEVIGELSSIIYPGEGLDIQMIELYYPDVDQEYYPVFSVKTFYRLVLVTGTNRFGLPKYQVIDLNQYYMNVRLQTVEYDESVKPVIETPSQLLGFNSYEIGSKFK